VCRPLKYPNSDKQTNGKSANVNWALRQAIYGSNRRPQQEDVIVIFDCDHRPKPHFFTRVRAPGGGIKSQ
jgi:cellulose synthase/poly-beta-1,6-N-acetylglucosamine synthase-like glycosyltransferase